MQVTKTLEGMAIEDWHNPKHQGFMNPTVESKRNLHILPSFPHHYQNTLW